MTMDQARYLVYFNLHRGDWSVMHRGRVIRHTDNAQAFDVEFRVRPAGHARVLREGKRNVHAFAAAKQCSYPSAGCQWFPMPGWFEISYDPYRGPAFYRKDTGEDIHRAARVILTPNGKAWAREA